MPVSNQFLANLLPFAAPRAGIGFAPDPTAGMYQGIPSGPAPGAPPMPGPSQVGPLNPAQAAAFAGVGAPTGPALPPPTTPPAAPPQPAPAAPQVAAASPAEATPPVAQAASQPALVAVRHAGTPGREVDTAGAKQKSLIQGAEDRRIEGAKEAMRYNVQAQDEIIAASQDANDRERAAIAGAQAAQAQEQAELARRNQAIEDAVAKRSVEQPKDFWADKSTGARIGMTLAAAIGAFGAAFGNGKNPAMDLLQADMQRDLQTKELRFRQQSQEANAKVDAAQASFNNMARQVGIHAAKDIEAAAQQRMMANDARILAAKTSIPEIQAKTEQMIAELTAKGKEYQATAMTKYIPPSGPSTGYIDPNIGIEMTRGEALKHRQGQEERREGQQNKLELQDLENQGKLAASKVTTRVDATTKGTQFIAKEMQQAKVPQYREALDSASALQQASDRGSGIAARAIWAKSPLVYGQLYGEEAAAREQAFQTLANVKIKEEAGGNVTQGEWDRQVAALYGAKTDRGRQNAINSLNRMLTSVEENIFAGAGPDATAAYKSNRAAQVPPPVDFTPSK